MINQQFGRLTVLQELKERSKDRHIIYVCKCVCGNVVNVSGRQLRVGKTQSCGCLHKESVARINRIVDDFNVTDHPLYSRWCGMLGRCYNPNNAKYPYYGARGIIVDPSWRTSFLTFANDMGECPKGYSLDRIDNDGNYSKQNCKWSTHKEQANNRRKRNSVKQMY